MNYRSVVLAGVAMVCLDCGRRPPPPPRVAGPVWVEVGEEAAYEAWSDVGAGTVVRYRVAWGADTSQWTDYVSGPTPVLLRNRWDSAGVWPVRAQASGNWGSSSYSSWSDLLAVAALPHPGYPNRILATTYLESHVSGLAFSPDGKLCYLALDQEDSITVLDIATGAASGGFRTGQSPAGLARGPGDTTLFVGCHDTIYVHRVSDFGVLRRIPVRGRASRLVVESVSGYVYVLDPGSVSRVLGIRAQDYVVTCSLIVNAEARDIEVVPGRSLLLVPDRQKNTVQVRTLSDFGLVATVPVCSYPDEIEVLPDGSLAYAAGAEGFGVAVVRTTDWTVRRMLPIEPGAGSICAMPGSRHAFLAAWSFSGVVVLSTLNDSVVASIESPACGFVRVSPDGRCLVTTDCDSQLDIIGFGQSQAP